MFSWQTDTLRQAIDKIDDLAAILKIRPASGRVLALTTERVWHREQRVECAQDLDWPEESDRAAACLLLLGDVLRARLRANEEKSAGKR